MHFGLFFSILFSSLNRYLKAARHMLRGMEDTMFFCCCCCGRSGSMLSTQQAKAKDSHLPSNWSSMPFKTQYKRVSLSCSSEEFKDVEKHFRKSMKRSVEVLKIERVQNPFMWEKYQR